ncbi:MAG: transcription-repair coupling factor [Oscillospiraceae bacterium]|jgi:transcription-repair coupling factor (superfamily II helicase)|nr:transcription-repair coupling factor [Oscillospiraceae bacterium]
MHFLLKSLSAGSEYRALLHAVRSFALPAAVTGVSHIHKAHLAAALLTDTGRRGLFITADEAEANRTADDMRALGLRTLLLPGRDLTFRPVEGISREYEHLRLGTLAQMRRGDFDALVCSVDAALMFTLPPDALSHHTLHIKVGEKIACGGERLNLKEVTDKLISSGYVRADLTEGSGQFAVRGGILDIFTADRERPVRVELWGDEVDSAAEIDARIQRRLEPLQEIFISPATEVLFDSAGALANKLEEYKRSKKHRPQAEKMLDEDIERLRNGRHLGALDRYLRLAWPKPATVFDYTGNGLCFFSESVKIRDRATAFLWQLHQDEEELLAEGVLTQGMCGFAMEWAEFLATAEKNGAVIMDAFPHSGYGLRIRETVNITARQLSVWSGGLEILCEDLQPETTQANACVVLAGTDRAAENLVAELRERHVPALYAPNPTELRKGVVTVTAGWLSAGFHYPGAGLLCVTHGATAAKRVNPIRKNKHHGDRVDSLSELSKGDYVVHSAHGVGIFDGIEKKELSGVVKDYIKIRYMGSDVLFVPVTQLDMVMRYKGAGDEGTAKLSRLGGQDWQKTRARVKKAVKEMAGQLTALYAARMNAPGFAFPADSDLQNDFERRFEYEETEDQLRCAAEIKSDMERSAPMDRLLCGDVGFGKTEVALRAAFKCVDGGKQAALLVPTTILAWQHYQTALRRFEGLPVKVEFLSRFRTPKEQAQIIKAANRGNVDLLIGTHRLISSDVKFHDLGLLIVDEEQRFGVAQKEKLKEAFKDIDVLTLSATPIPRTLNMAMSGLRDMSVLEEAPQDRHPVQTYVLEYNSVILQEALRKELRRGGQAYWLHNRVESIEKTAAGLAKLFPEARIGVAHGQMTEDELSAVWQRLVDAEIDILVCTTIIEAGVDVANVNTLIIEDSDKMGLSQLHQIRGRVGRSSRRAYAYLTFRRGRILTEIAQKRLEAIREFAEFGSGFKIAMRDLELRGAGNVLGGEQHGHMEAVGYDMYLRLLSDAVNEEKGEKTAPAGECTIDLPVTAHIPERYIESNAQRIFIYRRIADIRNREDADDVIDELIDRYGEPPAAVGGLIQIALLRAKAESLGIVEVSQRSDVMLLYIKDLNMEAASRLVKGLRGRVLVNAGTKPYFSVRPKAGESALETLESALDALGGEA